MALEGHAVVPWEESIRVTPFHTIKRAQVWLDPGKAHYMSGSGNNRELMLAKPQLEAIAEAAGFEIVESRRLDADSPDQIVWQVKGRIIGTDGMEKLITKTYELDMRLKERDGVDGGYILLARQRVYEKTRKIRDKPNSYPKHKPWHPSLDDDEGWEAYIEEQAMKDWTMTFRHKVRRAETGAALACIRSKLRIRSTYNEKEFAQPWVVYRAEFDVQRALAAGGTVGEMALQGVAGMMAKSLGLSGDTIHGLLANIEKPTNGEYTDPGMEDLANATEEEIGGLEEAMGGVGFGSRAACDGRSMEIFDLPLSQLTQRHVRLMLEYIEVGAAAVAAKLEKEEMVELSGALFAAMRLAYADGGMVEDHVEERLWSKVYPVEEEEEPEEESGEEEESEEEPTEEGEEATEEGDEETTDEEAEEEEEKE